MWTHKDNFNLLPNINAKAAYKDGVLKRYDLYPADGYVLHIPSGDYMEYDSEGKVTLYEPYYSRGGGTCSANYDFATNPDGYETVPISSLSPENLKMLQGGIKP